MTPQKTEQQDALDRVAARLEESFDGFVVLGFKQDEEGYWTVHNKMNGGLLINAGLTTAFLNRMYEELEETQDGE